MFITSHQHAINSFLIILNIYLLIKQILSKLKEMLSANVYPGTWG